ncbi:MAG: Wzz/FepE/Etk N-terminal domain-containing protein, partial [Desulfobacteraceae bacterium]
MAQYDINLREYWRILKKRKLIVVLTAIILGIFSTAFAILKAPTPIYTSICSIKFEKETTVEGLYAKTLTWSSGDDIETQISIISSYSVFKRVAQRLGLIPKMAIPADSHMKSNVIRIIDNLQSKVEVKRQNYTNILNIQVKDTNPAFAQKLANTIASTYRDLHSENQMKRTTEAIKYIEEQLSSVRQRLQKAEEEFNRFSQDNQLL